MEYFWMYKWVFPLCYQLQLSIQRDWPVPEDSVAKIVASGLLAAVTIDIEEGISDSLLDPKSEIESREAANLFAAVNEVAEDIRSLSNDGIKCNVTAILLIEQVKEIYQASNPKTDIIISIFAGRIADTGVDPISTMREAVNLCKNKKKIQILWASCRELINIMQADSAGSHIITVPHQILKKIDGVGKDLGQLSLETVKTFLSDAVSAGYKIKTNKWNLNQFLLQVVLVMWEVR